MAQMFDQPGGIAAAIALGILHLRADLGAAFSEPDEVNGSELPVDAGAGRSGSRFVYLRRSHVTG
ncbi:hypothetical protein IVA93_23635 [Bradyrhizobium sp. 155]|uniref:hypothetical protein n=1 Tax=Bradyrhizobium sp. 155 TaxID=2782629 RepID=UPI001FFE7253|nr:hypothetical protein [Bradyrhizobium sp. 155]UPK09342.1 hypothetical protein IVA93_23635 [Bradyrhizobium sp. 155]